MANYVTAELKRFNHLSSEIEALYHEAALKFHLSDSALLILYTICCEGDNCLLCDIHRLSGISKQTINSSLRRLEADKIVFTEVSDGKKKRVYLTDKGRKLAEITAVRLIEIENHIFSSWTKAENDLYLELTQRYLNAFQDQIDKIT